MSPWMPVDVEGQFRAAVLREAMLSVVLGAEPKDIYRVLKGLVDAAPEDVKA